MFHKVKEVILLLDKWQAFKALSDVAGLFNQVKVAAGGYGISWNDEIDLSCDELYFNGKSLER